MNYYECMQESINYIETMIYEEIDLNKAADRAFMSLSNYYRLFFAIVGCNVKEYIRLRRIHLAAQDLLSNDCSILDTAVKYGFTSADSFSRAFKKATGFLPSIFRKQERQYIFERVDIMDKYFEEQDLELSEKYPDIKVLKETGSFYGAAFRADSKTPENDAFMGLKAWFDRNNIGDIMPDYRVYGYDIPNSGKEDGTYGYEVVVTIPDDFEVMGEGVVKKHFEGGLYAVTETTVGDIVKAWQRFISWLDISRYEMGAHQCLEEHEIDSGFLKRDFENPENIRINLYMPVVKRSQTEYGKVTLQPVRVAYYREYGNDSEQTAHNVFKVMLAWAKKNRLDCSKCKMYLYNHGFTKVKKFWFEIMITLDENFVFQDDLIQEKIFEGGKYLTYDTSLSHLMPSWQKVNQYAASNKIKSGKHQWVEEWNLDNWECPGKGIKIYFPLA